MQNKTTKVSLLTVLIILLIAGASVGAYFMFREPTGQSVSAPSGKYIEVPVFMYYECSPASAKKTGDWNDIPSQGAVVECPANSDTCDIDFRWIDDTGRGYTELRYQKCIKNSNNCESEKIISLERLGKNEFPLDQVVITLFNIRRDQQVNIQFLDSLANIFFTGRDIGQARANFNPFILWKNGIFSGGRSEYTSIQQGCVFPTADRKNLIERAINLIIPHDDDSIDSFELEPYKTRNFIETFVPIAKANVNFVSYLGQTGYCLNRDVYSIATVEAEGETYQIVDTNINSKLKSNVECCPGEREPTRKCNSQFKWEQIAGSECSLFNPCVGIDWQCFGSGSTQRRFDCENGFCVERTKTVECCTDDDCLTSAKGRFCDSFTNECSGIPDINITKKEDCFNGIDDDGDGFIDLDDNDCQDAEECPPIVLIEPHPPLIKKGITIPNVICKIGLFFEKVRMIASIIVGLLGGLISIAYLNRFVKIKNKRNKILILLGTFIILGISTGILAFLYFWWIVLALALLGIIRAFIPGI